MSNIFDDVFSLIVEGAEMNWNKKGFPKEEYVGVKPAAIDVDAKLDGICGNPKT
jgi:hypothetical protein